MGIIKRGYTFTDKNEDWASRKATAIRLNKLIDDSVWDGALNSDGYAPDDGITPNDPSSLSYTSGVESVILSWSWTQNTQPLKTWIYENTTSSLPSSPSFYVGQEQRTFFRNNLVAGSVRYYWIKVEARNGRFSNTVGPLAATVATWPVTNTITDNLGKKITRSSTAPSAPNDGDIWINTSDNNILYRYDTSSWVPYPDKRVDSIADEYVMMVTPTGAGPSQRIMGFRATNADAGKLVSSATRSANVVTIVTSTAHGYSSTDLISITSLGYATTNPNGSYLITVSNTTTFTYVLPSGSGSEVYNASVAYVTKGTEFVIQADKFAVIDSTGVGQIAPFQVVGGITYIKNALIQEVAAGKITAGTITSQAITISDGATSGSGTIQSSGFTEGSSGWRIRGTGDAEFNTVTVRNGTITGSGINTPTITSAVFTDALVINSTIGIRKSGDNQVLTITGASDNGANYGAQIDLVGNNFGGTGLGGYLLLQAGTGTASEIRMHTNLSTDVSGKVGVERMTIDTYGLVNVARNLSSGSVYTKDAGNLWVDSNLAVGSTGPVSVNTSTGNISASGEVYSSGAGASKVGFMSQSDPPNGLTYVGLSYNSGSGRAELTASTGEAANTITAADRFNQVVTITTATSHGYFSGDYVNIGGIGFSATNPNGYYQINSISSPTVFTYTLTVFSVGFETYTTSSAYISGGSAYKDVHIAKNAKIMFGTHVATALSVTGYIEIRDSSGTIRKLAVVS